MMSSRERSKRFFLKEQEEGCLRAPFHSSRNVLVLGTRVE